MARECVCYLCNTKIFFLWKCTRVQYIERIGSTPPFFDRQIAAPIYRIYSKPTQYTLEHELNNSEQLSEKRQIAVIELDVTLICFCDIYLNWTLCVCVCVSIHIDANTIARIQFISMHEFICAIRGKNETKQRDQTCVWSRSWLYSYIIVINFLQNIHSNFAIQNSLIS